ncbi:MAG: PDZ domain-containing protein [Myxococcota bacterium]|nr:PDZ domain-containing protein [Myxococcota bacterium]
MIRLLSAVLLGIFLGGSMTWLVMSDRDRPSDDEVTAPGIEKPGLGEELRAQKDRIRSLEAELAVREIPSPTLPVISESPEPVPAAEEPTDSAPTEKAWFDSAALEAEGWTADQALRIRRRWERLQMEKLDIENQRARKVPGWKKLGKEQFQIQVEARRDLGDEDYEAMRFASGEPNRVVLTELLETSPAAEAGLLPEDEVISYDGQRVFTAAALKFLTQVGELGAATEIRVLRGGLEQRYFVPRGPLGTRLEAQVRSPYP